MKEMHKKQQFHIVECQPFSPGRWNHKLFPSRRPTVCGCRCRCMTHSRPCLKPTFLDPPAREGNSKSNVKLHTTTSSFVFFTCRNVVGVTSHRLQSLNDPPLARAWSDPFRHKKVAILSYSYQIIQKLILHILVLTMQVYSALQHTCSGVWNRRTKRGLIPQVEMIKEFHAGCHYST